MVVGGDGEGPAARHAVVLFEKAGCSTRRAIGVEAFVDSYGPERLLYGSGFPEAYHGGMMLALRHAEISDDAKGEIAAGNLDRLLREVRL